ncbi:SemiSWEET transporter [Alsobacter sp. SYSU M60028]|uniref:SemiSWEET transporter n=1 Tax=Alsobacter ponti TaxID=2962936 RepID=A0ABT1L6M7_9HYPH|nr:SemiSWEET transporter [Alsobacter ponti]MCP8937054.1 SemiSWEET transporter [Alsobacter ponti]
MSPFLIEVIGAVAAVTTTVCWLPQALRVIRTRDTRAISAWAQGTLLIGIILWIIYGFGIGSQPVIWSNTISFMLIGTIFTLKLRYG